MSEANYGMGDIAAGEFSYNGINSSTYNVYYIPDANDRWLADPDWDMYQTDVPWRHGGYGYGNRVKVRTFTLKCFYEQIDLKTREDIRKWLHRDTSGRLIFDKLPFVYWNVCPGKAIPGTRYMDDDSEKFSGTFTITMTAYDPFGYLTRTCNTGNENDNANWYCDLIAQSSMPAAPSGSDTYFDVYNPGREDCGLSVTLSGSTSNPIRLINGRNNTQCILAGLPANRYLDINGDTGLVLVKSGVFASSGTNGFAFHDRGVVRLVPGTNRIRIEEQGAYGSWSSNRSTLSLSHISIDYHPRIL